jgi:hypothetical protein
VALHHAGKFPPQVERFLNPRVHSLCTGWAVHMRSIASKEYAADPQLFDHPAVQMKMRRPRQVLKLHRMMDTPCGERAAFLERRRRRCDLRRCAGSGSDS